MLFEDQRGGSPPSGADISAAARREAVQKVLASATLHKSARLRDLLLYLADRSLEDTDASIPEQEIGIAVFGRKDYDASQDNLVRVQVTHLRRKLEQYFADEGVGDSVVFELPRGSYALRFHRRGTVPARPGIRRLKPVLLTAVCGFALIALGWFARGLTIDTQSKQPTVHKFWTQFFGNGLDTHIVLADANAQVFQDFVKESLGLRQYGRSNLMQRMVEERYQDPEIRRLILRQAGKYFVTFPDAAASRRIEALGLTDHARVKYRFARSFNVDHLMTDNAVLLGNRRVNPWIELFESGLRFRFVFDEQKVAAAFEDTGAGEREPKVYPTAWERESHCRVTVMPNLQQTGNVLIVAGGDQSASQAGSELLTNERRMADLARRLGVSGKKPFPYFEVLLKTQTISDAAPSFEILFCRVIR
jgi:hypothetical protein